MKKFWLTVLGGAAVGVLLACLFLFVRVRFADGVADFFARERTSTPIAQAVQSAFGRKGEQYKIGAYTASVPSEGKAVYADIAAMTLTLYENGEKVGEYPIKSVGREGTAWQTPIGQFDMSYKKENHFSSIGHVWMPYSMHFFGNYFIHGWPYYPDGTPVPQGYSGGCIRMETVDAQQVFAFVDSDTVLVVAPKDKFEPSGDAFAYDVDKDVSGDISAAAYLVADLETGEVVAAKNQKGEIGGEFAKLMTAIISLEGLNQYHETTLEGHDVTVGDMLYALLLTDSDAAAQRLYDRRNHAQYLIDMDDRAKSIGMTNTVYEDVTGDSSETRSSLEDTFLLVQYAKRYKPFLLKALGQTEYEVKDVVTWDAIHPLRDADGYVAGFAGDDNRAAMTVVSVQLAGVSDKKQFVVLVQGSADAGRDSAGLVDWLKANVKAK